MRRRVVLDNPPEGCAWEVLQKNRGTAGYLRDCKRRARAYWVSPANGTLTIRGLCYQHAKEAPSWMAVVWMDPR